MSWAFQGEMQGVEPVHGALLRGIRIRVDEEADHAVRAVLGDGEVERKDLGEAASHRETDRGRIELDEEPDDVERRPVLDGEVQRDVPSPVE